MRAKVASVDRFACPLSAALLVVIGILPGRVLTANEIVDSVLVVVGKVPITRYDAVTAWWLEGRPAQSAEELVESLVDRQLLLAEGVRFGLADEGRAAVSDAQVRAGVAAVATQGGAIEASAVRRWLEEEAIIAAFRRIRVDPFVRVDRAAVRATFEADRARYKGKRFFEVEEEIRESMLSVARRERLQELLVELRRKAVIHRPESVVAFDLPPQEAAGPLP
jgi:hypothetical protein